MGIDLIRGGRIANRGFRATKSSNSYLKSLIKVPIKQRSFTPSSPEEPNPSSMRWSTRDSTKHAWTDTPSPSPESLNICQTTTQQSLRERPSTTPGSSPLLDQSPTTLDSSTSPKDSESQPLDLPKLPEKESLLPKVHPWPSINSPNSPPLERVSSFWEAPETERQKDISVWPLVKRDHTLLLASDHKVENSKGLEAEDDRLFKLNKQI